MSEEKAGFLSRLYFSYATPLFVKGWKLNHKKKNTPQVVEGGSSKDVVNPGNNLDKQELEFDDFWELPSEDETQRVSADFEKSWELHSKTLKGEALMSKVIVDVIYHHMFVAGVIKVLNSGLQFAYPLLLRGLLNELMYGYYYKQPNSYNLAYAYSVGLGSAMFLKAMTENIYFWHCSRAGWQLRVAMSSAVYKKSVNLSQAARMTKTLGQMVNLMQLDATKMEVFMSQAHPLWDGIFQIIGYIIILYFIIGWSAFVGLAFMMTAIPLQLMLMFRIMKVDRKVVGVTDNRVKSTNEAVQGMLGVKMANWEGAFLKTLEDLRNKESEMLRSNINYRAFSSAYMSSIPVITAVIAIVTYSLAQDGLITAAILFSALSAFGQLRFPLMFYPLSLAQFAQFKVSRKRISDFLALDDVSMLRPALDEKSELAVELENVTVYWSDPNSNLTPIDLPLTKKQKKQKLREEKKQRKVQEAAKSFSTTPPTGKPNNNNDGNNVAKPSQQQQQQQLIVKTPMLTNVSIQVKKRELLAVIGEVGSGKTALVQTILGEMFQTGGAVRLSSHKIAYASQTPWIMNETFERNVLFGEPYDMQKYDQVCRACQLLPDLKLLPDGSNTEIGERGVSLSGGQKQRLSVARAAYSSAPIVILDDPLSALDPEVAARLFEETILGDLMNQRTRIVVTNQLNVLEKCDRIVVIGKLNETEYGVKEIGTYAKLIADGLDFSKLIKRQEEEETGSDEEEEALEKGKGEKPKKRADSTKNEEKVLASSSVSLKPAHSIMVKEERAKGSVQTNLYYAYIVAGGGLGLFSVVYSFYILSQGAAFINTYWLTLWSNSAMSKYSNQPLNFWLVGYALTAILLGVFTYCRTALMYWMAIRANSKLHHDMLGAVLHATMRFFDTIPTGRVLQRFSRDMYSLDTELPENWGFFMFTSLFILTSLATIIALTPFFTIFFLPACVVYFYFLQVYRPVLRDAKRIGSIVTSPVYAHFSETLSGLLTIRAFESKARFTDKNFMLLDTANRMNYALKLCERWLGVRLEMLGSAISLTTACLTVQAVSANNLTPGGAGTALTFAMTTTFLLTSTVRTFAVLEAAMNSVERVKYLGDIEQERTKGTEEANWQDLGGSIEVTNLSMRYREDTPMILKNVSFKVERGEKIGVIGRTGSGKSSLFLSLLRIVEPQPGSSIKIDGVEVTKIDLSKLRGYLGVSPQLPVLFSGSVRYNLDPFGVKQDVEIWNCLEKVGLGETIRKNSGLDYLVSEYGENFSQGERQLLSLARMLLFSPKIILLDEATASLDSDKDEMIQTVLRENFKDTTILVIAHRLKTIIDADKIIVFDKGEIAEQGEPDDLLQNPNSQLSQTLNEVGEKQAKFLRKQASSAKSFRMSRKQLLFENPIV